MNALLASVSNGWQNMTDRQKLMITFTALGTPIDRVGRTGFWSAGRRYIFDDNGDLSKVLDYCTDGRLSHSARLSAK